jgi:futalosine hydrolase
MEKNRRILIMTSVPAERDAVLRGIGNVDRIDVQLAGVGPVSAAVQTMKRLSQQPYDLVISMGIAGGFVGKAETGSLVIAKTILSADLGAESPKGFISLDELGFGSSTRVPLDAELVSAVLSAAVEAHLPVCSGTVLTLSTVTGTKETALRLLESEPDAVAEAMEGYGVAIAAQEFGVPVLEVRAVSNPIGPRDRSAWRIKEALDTLEEASKVITEVL